MPLAHYEVFDHDNGLETYVYVYITSLLYMKITFGFLFY